MDAVPDRDVINQTPPSPVASRELKAEAARRVGFDNIVRQQGWGGVPSRQIGLAVREMIRMGEEELSRR